MKRPVGKDSASRKRSNAAARRLLGLFAAAALAVGGCAEGGGERSERRVTVIGIDGAAPRIVELWMAQGHLPNLAKLRAEGAYGPIRSHQPILSPRIWTSIASGKTPLGHQIGTWVKELGGGRVRLYRGSDRHGAALWNIASDAGYRVGIVNWLMTDPPELVNGVMISDFAIPGAQDARFDLARTMRDAMKAESPETAAGWVDGQARPLDQAVVPAEWATRFGALLDELGPDVETRARADGLLDRPLEEGMVPMLTRPYAIDSVAARAAVEIARVEDPDLLMVLLTGIDRVSHFLWAGVEAPVRYAEEARQPPERRAMMRDALRAYYALTDRWIGEILEARGPEGLVLIMSDHGFEADWRPELGRTGGHDTDAALDGVVFARGPGFRPGATIEGAGVNDITPTVLAWWGLPAASDMGGRPIRPLREHRTRIPTYNHLEIERLETDDERAEARILEELRALGYIE